MKDIFQSFYDPIDMTCCMEDNESLEPLQKLMALDNLFFPFYQKNYSLRDIIQHCKYETFSYRYGSLADNILGVLVENKNGVQFNLGARVVKNVTGFDFTRFFTQNENEFGQIKKAILRLRPHPENISKYLFLHHKANCEKMVQLLLHSPWATSLMGLDFLGDDILYSIEITIGGSEEEIEIIHRVLDDIARKCDGALIKKIEIDTLPISFSVQGNLLLSKNIEFGDFLIKKFGGSYKGLLGNGYFLYKPNNFEQFCNYQPDVLKEIKKINGNIYWNGLRDQTEPLGDIRKKMLQAMKEIS